MSAPSPSELNKTFDRISDDAKSKGLGWGEWLSLAVSKLNFYIQRSDLIAFLYTFRLQHLSRSTLQLPFKHYTNILFLLLSRSVNESRGRV